MRVLHITPYVASKFGGPSQVIKDMVLANKLAGIKADILTTSAGLTDEDKIKLKNFYQGHDSNLIIQQISKLGLWHYAPLMKEWLEKNRSNYDLIHLHIPFTYPFAVGAEAAKKADIPYVISSHGLLSQYCLKQKYLKKKMYLELFERKRINASSCLFVTTDFEANEIAFHNFKTEIKIMPLAVENKGQRKENYSNSEALKIVCTARLHPIKNIPILLRAVERVYAKGFQISLDIAGEGTSGYENMLRNLVKLLNIDQIVKFHGHLSTKDVNNLLLQSDVFVILSSHENFCLSAAEASAVGLPVILSDQVGIATEVKQAEAGLIVPVGDVSETTDALIKMFAPSMREKYGNNGDDLAKNCFSIQRLSSELNSNYSAILN